MKKLLCLLLLATPLYANAPSIVASVKLLNNQNGIPPTVLYQPSAQHLYRASVYFVPLSASGQDDWALVINYSDDTKAQSQQCNMTIAVGTPSTCVFLIDANPGIITYQLNQGVVLATYDLFMTVEQLQ